MARETTRQASSFYQDAAFLGVLLSRPAESDACWACGLEEDLISFNLRKDFGSLGLDLGRRPGTFPLCWACAERYMKSTRPCPSPTATDRPACTKPWPRPL